MKIQAALRMNIRTYLPLILACAFATRSVPAKSEALDLSETTPALLRDLANNSISILETYRAYKETFEEKRCKRYDSASDTLVDRPNAFLILVDFNIVLPLLKGGDNTVVIPTNFGNFNAGIQKTSAAYYVGYLVRQTEFGAYVILDEVGLSMVKEDFAGREFLFAGRGESEAMGFDAGYAIAALFWKSGSLDFNIGGLYRTLPRTGFDSLGRETFRFQKEDNGQYEGDETQGELFLDVSAGRYSFNTLYSGENGLRYVGMGFGLGKKEFTLRPFLRYMRYRSRVQTGVTIEKPYGERLSASLEGAAELHRNSSGNMAPYFHALLGTREILFRLPRSRLSEFSGYDFHMIIDQSVSASTDALGAFVAGAGAGLSFEDILGLFSARLGVGYNEYRHLSAFPIRDRCILDLKAQLAW